MSLYKLTLYGMYRYRNDIFDYMKMPSGIEIPVLIQQILFRAGQNQLYIAEPDILKLQISVWCTVKNYEFTTLYNSTTYDYDAIENYDRIEERTSDSNSNENVSSTDSVSGNTTSKISGENQSDKNGNSAETKNYNEFEDNSVNKTSTSNEQLNSQSGTSSEGRINTSVENGAFENKTTTGDKTISRAAFDSDNLKNVERENVTENVNTDSSYNTATESFDKRYDETNTATTTNININENETGKREKNVNEHSNFTNNETEHTSLNRDETSVSDSNGKSTSEKNYESNVKERIRAHGNIGVTTTQKMLEEERAIAKFSIYDYIAREFEKTFTLSVY